MQSQHCTLATFNQPSRWACHCSCCSFACWAMVQLRLLEGCWLSIYNPNSLIEFTLTCLAQVRILTIMFRLINRSLHLVSLNFNPLVSEKRYSQPGSCQRLPGTHTSVCCHDRSSVICVLYLVDFWPEYLLSHQIEAHWHVNHQDPHILCWRP